MYKKGDYVVREVGGQCHHDGDGYGGLVDEDGTVHKWRHNFWGHSTIEIYFKLMVYL